MPINAFDAAPAEFVVSTVGVELLSTTAYRREKSCHDTVYSVVLVELMDCGLDKSMSLVASQLTVQIQLDPPGQPYMTRLTPILTLCLGLRPIVI